MRELLAELSESLDQGRACVYCSVVETRGSTPQKAGAAMLVLPDGGQRGTLGGGCIEAEVKQRALRVLSEGSGGSELLTFCLDDNYGWDDGLICGGRMTILAEPLNQGQVAKGEGRARDAVSYYSTYRRIVAAGKGCTEVVALASNEFGLPGGTRFLVDEAGTIRAQLAEGEVPPGVLELLRPLRERPRPSARRGLAFLPHLPRITLLIVGGGHVGEAVARLARDVDFDIWVLDDRERYASPERFPMARRIVGDVSVKLKELAPTLGPSHYALVVTRGHNHDEEALYHLAPTNAGYVGMIGSKRKIKLIFEDLLAKGITAETLARVHAPLGFDIGSQTVPEIAVSIVSELIASRNLGTTDLPARVRVKPETLGS
jgi:xanthine dehydrogenase accessory factor